MNTLRIPSTPKVRDKNNNDIPIWHIQQEQILKRWSEIGSSYRYLHDKSFKKYNSQNMLFALPVIIISTITGTANFAQGSFPSSWQTYVPLGIGFLNLSAGLITTISQFLRVSELLEGHRSASIAYSKFARNISVELSLPVKERTEDGSIFITNCRAELDRLIEQSPDIPEDIIKQFVKRFPEPRKDSSGNLTNEYSFFRPEILDIKPIKIYRDDEAEIKRKKIEQKREAEKIAQEDAKKLKKILELQEKERLKIKTELESNHQKQNENVKQLIELAQLKSNKEIIKNKFNTNNIEENMANLLGTLTQNIENVSDISSDSDSDNDNTASPNNPNIEVNNVSILIRDPSNNEL